MVEMRPCDFTNDTHVIRGFSRMTAINSAISIDLTGQVCADSIGWHLYSGVGGQMDFIRGAALAPGGPGDHRPAIDGGGRDASRGSCRSWPRVRASSRPGPTSGRWSRSGASPSSTASRIRERAQALIAIAHPDFRDELTAQARATHYL